jgi:hypothetical protein
LARARCQLPVVGCQALGDISECPQQSDRDPVFGAGLKSESRQLKSVQGLDVNFGFVIGFLLL